MPSQKRMIEEFTPELRERWETARDRVLAAKDEIAEEFRLVQEAGREPTFSGRLRRAIHGGPMLLDDLCKRVDVDLDLMGDFLRGEAALDSPAIDRLVAVLGWPAVVAAEAPEESQSP